MGDYGTPKGSWDVEGPGISGTPAGWAVKLAGTNNSNRTLTVTIPAGLPTANYGAYNVSLCTGQRGNSDTGSAVGYYCRFQVSAPPPPMPAAGMPAFSWQGSVAGVSTGNGNKTTTVPIVGWTMRGGMPVSCALIHNSQGPLYAAYGSRWLCSYFTYITGGPSAPVLHWDNGLSYSFTLKSGGGYDAPYGIFDKLAYTNNTFTLTATNQTVYTFGFAPGNAYLSAITDKDGNTLSIGHNSDTTISTVSDPTGRTLTYNYGGGYLQSITDPLGRVYALFYMGSDLIQVNTPILNGQYYALVRVGYDGYHEITSLKNMRGYASTFGYDGAGRLTSAKDPLGNQTTFTYNSDNTVITDPNGHTTTHSYSTSILYKVTDALNYFSHTYFDYNHNLSCVSSFPCP